MSAQDFSSPNHLELATDSLSAVQAENDSGVSVELPQAAPLEAASQLAPLLERPASEYLTFVGTPAAEAALRFSNEYRISVVFMGDGRLPVSGSAKRGEPILEMLRGVFQSPEWTVTHHAGSYLVAGKPSVSFRSIALTSIAPKKSSN